MKKEDELLSEYTGYSIAELHERLTEPILQPYDCIMAMIEFKDQVNDVSTSEDKTLNSACVSTRELLSDYAHEAWCGWMKYMFSKSEINEDGTWTMPQWAVERWQRQMDTKYKELPEGEKKSDREEADRMLDIFNIGI